MKKILAQTGIISALLITLLMIGCGTAQKVDLPVAPKAENDAQRDCIMNCQVLHNDCLRACKHEISVNEIPFMAFKRMQRQEECCNQCNQKLGECYRLCEGID